MRYCLYMQWKASLTNEEKLNVIESVLVKVDPIGLIEEGAPKDEYHPEAKIILEAINNKKTAIFFWKEIQKIFLEQFEIAMDKSVCKKISKQIFVALYDFLLLNELRKIPSMKAMDDNFCLKLHEDYVVQWREYNYLFINDVFFEDCEELDIEEYLPKLIENNGIYYVLYKGKKNYYKTFKKTDINIDDLIKDTNVLMVFDNKSSFYKA